MWIKTFSVFLLLALTALQAPGNHPGRFVETSLQDDKRHSLHSAALIYTVNQKGPFDSLEDAPEITSQTDLSVKSPLVSSNRWYAHFSQPKPRHELQPRSTQGPPSIPQLA